MIGQRIGCYRIDSLLGVGGMGEVYRAQDTKLRRDVAIKVLPQGFAVDAERLARFEREAQLLASLNHPHIASIYGFEEGDTSTGSLRALVLELVEGETLAERIERKPISLAEGLDIAHQIAAALDAAHEKGIVHRDLKPANVKITPAGVVKVLDFGIAKVVDGGDSRAAVGAIAVTELASRTFVVLGTAAYMSPEQARGGRVDKRADIWAFGCVLFELLTGKSAFARETVTDTLAWVVEHEPDWSLLPPTVAPAVRDLLRRCLEKDVRRRLRDIGDARCDEAGLAAPTTAGIARRSSPRVRVAWLLAGAVIGAAVLGAWLLRPVPQTAPVQPLTVRALTDAIGMEESPALSPDGKTVAFVARANGSRQIWLRLLAGGAPLQITRGALDHQEPRWTPDSSSIVYFTPPSVLGESGAVWQVSAFGGEPRRLTTALSAADVSRDGRRLAAIRLAGQGSELVTMTQDGSQTLHVQELGGVGVYGSLRWSPDGQWIAFEHLGQALNEQMHGGAGGWRRARALVARSSQVRGLSWLSDSSGVVYSSAAGSTMLYPPTRNLRAVGRDGRDDRALTFGDVSYTQPDVSASGAIVASRIRIQSNIWRFPLGGTPLENTRAAARITHQTGQAQTASVSPDGEQVAYDSDSGGHGNVWVARTDGTSARQVTFEQDPNVAIGVPVWSNTGSEIAVIVSRGGAAGLALVKAEGGTLREIVPDGVGASWSADDRWLYYNAVRGSVRCLEKIPVDGVGSAESVHCDASGHSVSRDMSAFYFVTYREIVAAEIRTASLEERDGPSTILATVSVDRIPVTPNQLVPTISPDGMALAMPLVDGETTNIWVLPTAGGPMRPVTDFGDRAVLIARRVAWSPDGRALYASVADIDSDVVLLAGLRP